MPSGTQFYGNVGVRHLQSELWVSSLGKGICPGFQDFCSPGGTLEEGYSVIFMSFRVNLETFLPPYISVSLYIM